MYSLIIQDSNKAKQKNKENEMKKFTVLLNDGTVGTITDDCLSGQHANAFIGEMVNVHLHDENGNNIEAEGILEEVLEEE